MKRKCKRPDMRRTGHRPLGAPSRLGEAFLWNASLWNASLLFCAALMACSQQPSPSATPPPAPGQARGPAGGLPPISAPPPIDQPATSIPGDPPGVPPSRGSSWTPPQVLASLPGGGHRPQIAIDAQGNRHVVYYLHQGNADVVVYREGAPQGKFSPPIPVSQGDAQNWGPDLVIGPDDRPYVSFDHAQPDFTGQVFITYKTASGWATPEQVSEDKGVETSSSHLAFDDQQRLHVVWLSREPKPGGRSRVMERIRNANGSWEKLRVLHDGRDDALHSNIMRSPRGELVMTFDRMVRPAYRQVHAAVWEGTSWSDFQPIGDADLSTERANFGFGQDLAFAAWTDSLSSDRIGVSLATARLEGNDTTFSAPNRLTRGILGRHYDPDVAGNSSGEVMLVWAWSDRGQSSILYAQWKKGQLETPQLLQARAGMASLPSIYAGADGSFHLVWNHGDPQNTEVLYAMTVPSLPANPPAPPRGIPQGPPPQR